MSSSSRNPGVYDLPDTPWDQNIRSTYGSHYILFGVAVVLLVALVILTMLLVRCFRNLFRVERLPLHAPSAENKRPNSARLVWNTLWEQPLPPGQFRSQPQLHSASTRRLTDSEHTSLYMEHQ